MMLQRAVAVLAMLMTVGCADDNVSVFVTGVIPPDQDEDSCTFDPAAADMPLLAPGTFNIETDVIIGRQPDYNLVLATSNQLQRRALSGRAETNGVFITRTEVTIEALDGSALALGGLPNPFSVPAAAYVPPATDPMTPGQGVVSSTAIPAQYATALAAALPRDAMGNLIESTVVVAVKLIGETQGHIDIETDEFRWPVQLCGGFCLFQCGESFAPYCLLGQDGVSLLDPMTPECIAAGAGGT